MTRILSRSDVESLLTMEDVIDAVEAGFRECADGGCHVPVRLPLDVPEQEAVVLFMPAYLPRAGTLGAKVVSVFPNNPARGRPVISGVYLLCDAGTGDLLALMDAAYLTGIRTAAASAVASKHLARRDARVLGIFGAGVQAGFHLRALRSILDLEAVVVFNRTRERGVAFVDEIRRIHRLPVHLADTPDACARAADVIAACTRSPTPVVHGRALRPGTHVNAVGAYTSGMREIDEEAIVRAKVVVDTYEGAMAEAGDLLIPMRRGVITRDHLHAELSEIVSGRKAGRTSEDEITVFKSVGFAMEDAVTAKLAYEQALKRDIGVEVAL